MGRVDKSLLAGVIHRFSGDTHGICASSIEPDDSVAGVNAAHAQARAEVAIRQSLDRLARAWNAGDATGWAEEYWDTADSINILGGLMPDRLAIRDRHAEIFLGPFKDSQLDGSARRVQFLDLNVAIVDVDIRVTRFKALPPGAVATSPGVLLTCLRHVYHCRDGAWRIAASQNTAVLPVARPLPTLDEENR